MNILKPGCPGSVLRGLCPTCGCIFECGVTEVHTVPQYLGRVVECPGCKCPHIPVYPNPEYSADVAWEWEAPEEGINV